MPRNPASASACTMSGIGRAAMAAIQESAKRVRTAP
jgi:hypothetical protein